MFVYNKDFFFFNGKALFLLTYDLHSVQVQPYFAEGGKPSGCVIFPTLAVVSPAPVIRTLGRVMQSASKQNPFYS